VLVVVGYLDLGAYFAVALEVFLFCLRKELSHNVACDIAVRLWRRRELLTMKRAWFLYHALYFGCVVFLVTNFALLVS